MNIVHRHGTSSGFSRSVIRRGVLAERPQPKTEIEALAHELARAVNLHGSDRKAVSATERARVNVTRAVKSALDRVAEHDRSLGLPPVFHSSHGHLLLLCPGPDDPPTWQP